MPDEDDDELESSASTAEEFHERLQEATQDLGLKLHFQPLVKSVYTIITKFMFCLFYNNNITLPFEFRNQIATLLRAQF